MPRERVQKILARAGIGSRRACERLIAEGRVRIDGRVARLGDRADPEAERIELDGVPVPTAPDLVYWLLNKPRGVVTTVADPRRRRTVMDLVPRHPRVFPVGRLDFDSEGLLVLTNDGELAYRLTHPSHGVDKEYLVQVRGSPSRGDLARLRSGVQLDDGPARAVKVSQPQDGMLRITVREGRNRLVRRMCDAIGHPVVRLVRIRIGPISDPKLRPGAYRQLERSEVVALYRAATEGRGAASL